MKGDDAMAKRVDIIGAGIAGLSAGCYLQMNGYEIHQQLERES
jgi:phytoene dehydrogenase-like protein